MKNRTKLLVLFGGQSTEHEISCISAASVLRNLDHEKFLVKACGITKNGDWIPVPGENETIDANAVETGAWETDFPAEELRGMVPGIELIRGADAVFPVVHGIMAEDGTIQGLLELLKKPYVGAGVLASAVCMDKVYAKIVLKEAGIPVVPSVVAEREDLGSFERVKKAVEEKIGYPCFVKPSNSGSSVGAYKVQSGDGLEECVKNAARFDRKVLVEKYVNAREVECAVLGNRHPRAATPGEILSTGEFYDYDDKYINGTSSTRIPADIPEEKRESIKALAVKAFRALDCAGFARVDFFVDRDTGEIYLNEVNTIPGFTNISMYPKMWENEGMSLKELITELVALSVENFNGNVRQLD